MVPTDEQRLAQRIEPPNTRPVMQQTWSDLLFLHWEVDPAAVQRTLPAGLTVDTFEGRAYVGLVPFWMRHIRPQGFPSVPGVSNFLEMNVRTYVFDRRGTPGVWFYSLDANQWCAVRVARRVFCLPYFDAKMRASIDPTQRVRYFVRRRGATEATQIEYRRSTVTSEAQLGTLEFFLAERYILFAHSPRGGLYSGQVHHMPYPLSAATLESCTEVAVQAAGFSVETQHPIHVIASPGVDVRVFGLQRLDEI